MNASLSRPALLDVLAPLAGRTFLGAVDASPPEAVELVFAGDAPNLVTIENRGDGWRVWLGGVAAPERYVTRDWP